MLAAFEDFKDEIFLQTLEDLSRETFASQWRIIQEEIMLQNHEIFKDKLG